MATQQPLVDRPGHRGGLWHTVLDNHDQVVDAAWKHATDTGQHVGTCRRCHQPLKPGTPYQVGRITWYPADCTSTTCDGHTAARGPRPARKSQGG